MWMKYAQMSSISPWAAVTWVLCSLSLVHTCSCVYAGFLYFVQHTLACSQTLQQVYSHVFYCGKCVVCKRACVQISVIIGIPLRFSSDFIYFLSCPFQLVVPFSFLLTYICSHIFTHLSLYVTCSIHNVQESFFFLYMHFLQLSLFQGRTHPLFIKSLEMLHERH